MRVFERRKRDRLIFRPLQRMLATEPGDRRTIEDATDGAGGGIALGRMIARPAMGSRAVRFSPARHPYRSDCPLSCD